MYRRSTALEPRQEQCEQIQGLGGSEACVTRVPMATFPQSNVNSTARSRQYSQRWFRWASAAPCLLCGDGPPEGSPVTGAPPSTVWPHLTAGCCQLPPGGEHERGGAAPRRRCSRWPNTHTYPRLMAWRWRGGACVRCCLLPLWPPKKFYKLDIFSNVWNTLDETILSANRNKILTDYTYNYIQL